MDGVELTGKRVLLVEDDLFFAGRILSVLNKLGCETERSATSEAGVERAAALDFDAVIVNLGSARLGGVETVRRLKRAGARRMIAYISHTRIPEIRDAVRAAGGDGIYANSAITMRLPSILQRVLSGRPPDETDDEE